MKQGSNRRLVALIVVEAIVVVALAAMVFSSPKGGSAPSSAASDAGQAQAASESEPSTEPQDSTAQSGDAEQEPAEAQASEADDGKVVDMGAYTFTLPDAWVDVATVKEMTQGNSRFTSLLMDGKYYCSTLFPGNAAFTDEPHTDFVLRQMLTLDNGNTLQVAEGVDGCNRARVTDPDGRTCFFDTYMAIDWRGGEEDTEAANRVRELQAAAAGLPADTDERTVVEACVRACAERIAFK